MTPALKAMVEAMWVEFRRQAHPHSGGVVARFSNAIDNPSDVGGHIGGDFDLEKVARAGLAAIKEPTEGMLYPGVHPCELEARLPNDPPHCYSEYHLAWNTAGLWRAMVAEVLEPTPVVSREGS